MRMALIPLLLLSVLAPAGLAADCPPCPAEPPPPPDWTLSIGAGLTRTGGNSETSSYNLSANVTHDPRRRNVLRAEVLYLRASEDDAKTVDRTLARVRDEYTTGPIFAFGEVGYQRDRFKEVDYLVAPLVGLGYKLVAGDQLVVAVDGGAGGAFEKLTDQDATADVAVQAGQRLEWKASSTATVFQKATALWKANDFGDAYYRFEAGVAAAVTRRLELKAAIADDYKPRPARPGLKKNDTSLIVALLFKP